MKGKKKEREMHVMIKIIRKKMTRNEKKKLITIYK